uniref:TATA box-binding protein-associated factor RNA polymerase I subunit B n=1 Tax=Elaeophora elaphi TaxID=1147741 RepID=A0A0R3RY32_9BILA
MSGYCSSCGSTDFIPVDGFFYCAVCNTQSQVLREFDHDDEGAFLMSASSTKIRRKKTRTGKSEREKKAVEKEKVDEDHLPALKQDFPTYLGHAGLRLATFTKLLSQFTAMLIRDFGVPECVKWHVLNILQHYLQHFRVAFCEEELDERNSYCPEAQKKAREVNAKAQKEAQLRHGDNVMSLISTPDIKANLDVHVHDLDMDDLEAIIEKRTKVSKDAFSTLLRIPMNIEIIMVILYLGCLLSGANWMLLSDVTRWFREGRFPISLFQSAALLVGGKGNDIFSAKGLSYCPRTPTMPLYEYMRTVMVIAQLTDIPVQPVPCSFDRVLARLCYNLNLPTDFIQHLHTICVISSPNVVFDAQFIHRFGNVDVQALLQKTNNAFCDNITVALEQSTYQLEEGCGRQYSVMPSIDVKAVAVILFALKLLFGLDDNMEFNMKTQFSAVNTKEEQFNFGLWMQQLKMRINVWRGRRLKDVLEKRTTALPKYDSIFKNYRMVLVRENYRGEKVSQIGTGRITGGRNLYFKECVPSNFVMDKRDYALCSTFEDDFDFTPSRSLSKEALLTPLRYQATHHVEWYEALEKSTSIDDFEKIDRYNADVFFKSFKNHRMEYEAVKASENKMVPRSEVGSCHSNEMRTKWRQLFPCSEHYESYPRPLYCPGLLKFTSGELIYTPMIYTPAVDVIYQNASPHFSESFSDLLEILSLMIGEDRKIVYAFFLMLEMKCLTPNTLNDFNEITKNCEEFTTCAQVELLGDEPRNVNVQLCRISEDVARADFKFLVTYIANIPVDMERTSKTSAKRRREKSCNLTPEKRSKEQRTQLFATEHPKEQINGMEEDDNVFARTHNEELTNDFKRMNLQSEGRQMSPSGRTNTSSRSMFSCDANTILSLSDDEISSTNPPRRQRYRKQDLISEFSRTNIFKRSLTEKIKNRFSEYFNFEFEVAFALAIPKYW